MYVCLQCVAFRISWSSNALYWAAVWTGSVVLVAVLTPDEDGCVCNIQLQELGGAAAAAGTRLPPITVSP